MTLYGADLAYIQDVAFGDFARNAAPGILAILKDRGIADGLVIDLGCGAGVWAQHLLDAGYDVLGVDSSRSLIEYARRRAPGARLEVGSVFDHEFVKCKAVTAVGEVLSYGVREPKSLFDRVYRSLDPGGVFVFDLPEPARDWTARRHMCGRGWALMYETTTPSPRRLERHITTFRQIGRTYRRSVETHALRLHVESEVVSKLEACGFTVSTSRRYGEQALLPHRVLYIAEKRRRSKTRKERSAKRSVPFNPRDAGT